MNEVRVQIEHHEHAMYRVTNQTCHNPCHADGPHSSAVKEYVINMVAICVPLCG